MHLERLALLTCVVLACSCRSKESTPVPDRERRTDMRVVAGTVAVPAGWFRAGCAELPADISDAGATTCTCSNPPRDVWVSGFEIDRLEATVQDYAACVHTGQCSPAASYRFRDVVPDDTAVIVEYSQAASYCAWQEKRLPTEAEWEKAARGVDGRMYPWGFDEPDCMTSAISSGLLDGLGHTWDLNGPVPKPLDCRPPYPGRVGMHPGDQSPYGALDMTGNVPEWTTDIAVGDRIEWRPGVSDCPSVGKAVKVEFIDSSAVDPHGPDADARERWLQSQWPDKEQLRATYPMRVARRGAIGRRSIEQLDSEGTFFAGIRCVRPNARGPLPAEPSASGSYEVTMHRESRTGRIIVESTPSNEISPQVTPDPLRKKRASNATRREPGR